MTTAPAIRSSRYGNLIAAVATVACCDVAFGLTLQLLPLLMEEQGLSASMMGANAAMGPIGILLAGPLLPRIVAKYGAKPVSYVVLAVLIAALLAFKLVPSIWLWFPLRFIFGVAAGALFTVSEALVLTATDDHNRGRIMSLYTSVLAVSFSAGPLIVPWTGIHGWMPWVIGAVFVAVAAMPLAFVNVSNEAFKQEEGNGFFKFVAKAPLLLAAVAAVTLFDNVFISFFSIFGMRSGLELSTASTILGIGIVGNVLFFYPMGMLADHWSRMGVVVVSSALTVILALSLILLIDTWLIWPAVILLSTTAFGVYVVALAIMGDKFKGTDLVSGSAAFAMMWGIGGLAGPPIAGVLIDAFGINAMPMTLAGFYVLLLIGLAITKGQLVRET